MLLQIVYLSKSASAMSDEQVTDLAKACAQTNKTQDITGVLYHHNGHFIQCLEGEDSALIKLYAQILNDPRHRDILTAVIRPIEERMFPAWSMGVVPEMQAEIDFDEILPLEAARKGCWNEQAWAKILDSFRLAAVLDPYPEG
jgi:hypothetical protein